MDKELFFKAARQKTRKVILENEDGSDFEVTIRQMSADELSEMADGGDVKDNAAKSIVASVIDEKTGEKIFAKEDVNRIRSEFSAEATIRLQRGINEFNGLGVLDETAKN